MAEAAADQAEDAVKDVPESSTPKEAPEFVKTTIKAPFLEQFDTNWASRWIPSAAKKVLDGVEDEDLLKYRGQWNVELGEEEVIKNDLGLVLKTVAAHSAIAAKFDQPIDPKGKTLVVQYEVKFQTGLECGGAYLKLLTHDPKFNANDLTDKTPYTIMFGPDKCGGSNKVHFIFRHKSPKTGEYEEKHLSSAPSSGVVDKKTILYTLVVRPDQSYEILVNNKSVSKGSLLESFSPSVNPPKEIDDPEDKKPADWVDEAQIVDPDATKPDDWDEDAPREIVDEDATMPEDWLEEELDTVPDPEVVKPEDWDDEEDGDWVAPSVPNPKCAEVSGCGPWKKPMIPNPAYKGKWTAPLIDNPAYKGVWAPRKIPNPNYFEDKKPADFNKMGAIGFELWSMQNGFLFDNIYIGHSEEDAKALAEETWVLKEALEKAKEPTPAPEADGTLAEKASGYVEQAKQVLTKTQVQVQDFVKLAQADFVGAVKELPHIAGLLVLAALIPLVFVSSLFSAPPAPKKAPAKKDEGGKGAEKETKPEASASGVEKSGTATKRK